MSAEHGDAHAAPSDRTVWFWLMGLMALSVVVSALEIGQGLTTLVVFGAATVKALLVVLYFMHLKFERLLVVGLVVSPLVLFAILLFGLMPDLVFGQWAIDPAVVPTVESGGHP